MPVYPDFSRGHDVYVYDLCEVSFSHVYAASPSEDAAGNKRDCLKVTGMVTCDLGMQQVGSPMK